MPNSQGRSLDDQPQTERRNPVRSVLIIDDNEACGTALGRSLRELNLDVSLETDFTAARNTVEMIRPDLVVTELKIGTTSVMDLLRWLKRQSAGTRAVIATFYPSVATAVQAIRLGADAYLAKPVDGRLIMTAAEDDAELGDSANPPWPSLDRTIWEYLNQVFMTAGSISEAARRLRLDRRSLRRMLNKFPPVR